MDSKFYTVEPIFEKVSKEEFEKFISEYPRRLDYDCCGISEPPCITYNDFELANLWPESVVARTWIENDHYGEADRYICTNIQEVFESKTGYVHEHKERSNEDFSMRVDGKSDFVIKIAGEPLPMPKCLTDCDFWEGERL